MERAPFLQQFYLIQVNHGLARCSTCSDHKVLRAEAYAQLLPGVMPKA